MKDANSISVGQFAISYGTLALVLLGLTVSLMMVIRYSFRRNVSLDDPTVSVRPTASIGGDSRLRRRAVPASAPTGLLVQSKWHLGMIVTILVLLSWGVIHAYTSYQAVVGRYTGQFKWPYLLIFLFVATQLVIAHCERPYRRASHWSDNEFVAILVPLYNEAPEIAREVLTAMFYSSRPPNAISVVDDGSSEVDYTELEQWFLAEAKELGIAGYWQHTPNRKKRSAQVTALSAIRRNHEPTIIVTVDSDSILDPQAIKEGLIPFQQPQVQGVAGLILTKNYRSGRFGGLLARIMDLRFTTDQLTDRSMMSRLGSVLVIGGGLGFYRAAVMTDNISAYLGETFRGRPVPFSDDSMLTLLALNRGKVVQQPTSIGFAMMPEKMQHHKNQQTRWKRGSFIRSMWRLRYLPLLSWGMLRQVTSWPILIMTTYMMIVLFVVNPLQGRPLSWEIFVIPLAISYLINLRYWAFRRSDMSLGQQLITYLLTPVAVLWSSIFLRGLTFYAWATCWKLKWGTREDVEVGSTPVLATPLAAPQLSSASGGTIAMTPAETRQSEEA